MQMIASGQLSLIARTEGRRSQRSGSSATPSPRCSRAAGPVRCVVRVAVNPGRKVGAVRCAVLGLPIWHRPSRTLRRDADDDPQEHQDTRTPQRPTAGLAGHVPRKGRHAVRLAGVGRLPAVRRRVQALLDWQCPHAADVAGYRIWQQLGRQTRTGEKAIKILGYSTTKITKPIQTRATRSRTGWRASRCGACSTGYLEIRRCAVVV